VHAGDGNDVNDTGIGVRLNQGFIKIILVAYQQSLSQSGLLPAFDIGFENRDDAFAYLKKEPLDTIPPDLI
jgi:hypothetical protein